MALRTLYGRTVSLHSPVVLMLGGKDILFTNIKLMEPHTNDFERRNEKQPDVRTAVRTKDTEPSVLDGEVKQPLSVFTPPITALRTRFSLRSSWQLFLLAGVAVLAIIVLGLTIVSKTSTPGTTLYPVKVYVAEKAIVLTKITVSARVTYETRRLEARLEELKALGTDGATSTPETLTLVSSLIEQHTSDAVNALAGTKANARQLDMLLQLAILTNASDEVADTSEEFAPMRDSIGNTRGQAGDSLRVAIETFASTSPEQEVKEYIGAQIEAVGNDIKKVAPGSTAERLAIVRVNDALEAITDGNVADALRYILKAREVIAVDQYLWDSERGPIDGAPLPTTEIPEGS